MPAAKPIHELTAVEQAAVESAWIKYQPLIRATCRRFPTSHEVDGVIAEALCRQIPRHRADSNVDADAWAVKVIRFAAGHVKRRARPLGYRNWGDRDKVAPTSSPISNAGLYEGRRTPDALAEQEILSMFPAQDREIFRDFAVEGKQQREIAEERGLSRQQVARSIERCRAIARGRLRADPAEEGGE